MHGARDDFFPGSALSSNKDGGIGTGNLLHHAEYTLHALAADYRAVDDMALVAGLFFLLIDSGLGFAISRFLGMQS